MNLILTVEEKNWIQMNREIDRHNAYLFGSIVSKLQAGKTKAEFYVDHQFPGGQYCQICQPEKKGKLDPRHRWTEEQWLAEADKELGK